jgi:hypothetical protein
MNATDDRNEAIRAVGDQAAEHLVSCATARLLGMPAEAAMASDRAYETLLSLGHKDLLWLAVDTLCDDEAGPKPRELKDLPKLHLAGWLVEFTWAEAEEEAEALLIELGNGNYVDERAGLLPTRPESGAS